MAEFRLVTPEIWSHLVPMDALENRRFAASRGWLRVPDGPAIIHFCVSAFILLSVLCLIVVVQPPPDIPRTPEELTERALERHNYNVYFKAIAVAKSLVPGAANIRWSHIGLEPTSMACVIPHGLWYAQGQADVPAEHGEPLRTPWQLLFDPGSTRVIFFRLGNMQVGDPEVAARAMRGP